MPTSRFDTCLAAVLAVASLGLWFGLGFPWDHHNESLVWVTDMQRAGIAHLFDWHPIRPVQTWRPLGVAMAWTGWQLTQGIALQQALNFAITVLAWWVALRASTARLAFGFAALLALAGFFSPYIYLFHLHGVFYGPLLVFLAWLLGRERLPADTGWNSAVSLLLLAGLAAMFHTFAFLFFAAYVGASWLELALRERRWPSPLPAVVTIVVAAAVTKLLVSGSSDLASGDPVLGLLTSYRALELNVLLSLLAGFFAVVAAAVAGRVHGGSPLLLGGLALAVSALLHVIGLPVTFAWILVCGIRALFERRLRLAALLGICALLPVATSTGSPTYTVYVLMPCLLITVDGLAIPAARLVLVRALGVAAVAATFGLLTLLRLEIPVPVVDGLAASLRAEGEKTHQLKEALDWLAADTSLTGQLALCSQADFPIRSGNPLNRQFRPPTPEWPLGEYLQLVTGQRLRQPDGAALRLCFGGERPETAEVLKVWPGRHAGDATLVRLAPG